MTRLYQSPEGARALCEKTRATSPTSAWMRHGRSLNDFRDSWEYNAGNFTGRRSGNPAVGVVSDRPKPMADREEAIYGICGARAFPPWHHRYHLAVGYKGSMVEEVFSGTAWLYRAGRNTPPSRCIMLMKKNFSAQPEPSKMLAVLSRRTAFLSERRHLLSDRLQPPGDHAWESDLDGTGAPEVPDISRYRLTVLMNEAPYRLTKSAEAKAEAPSTAECT